MIVEKPGNLLDCGGSIAHCVAQDMVLGAGVARSIREKYLKDRIVEMRSTKHEIGETCIVPIDGGHLFNIVTKPSSSRSRPTKENFEKAMKRFFSIMTECNIEHINVPRLGCGLDRLDWKGFVRPLLQELAKEHKINVIVWVL